MASDKERLDWLISEASKSGCGCNVNLGCYDLWRFPILDVFSHQTLRDAIDAAMKHSPDGERRTDAR